MDAKCERSPICRASGGNVSASTPRARSNTHQKTGRYSWRLKDLLRVILCLVKVVQAGTEISWNVLDSDTEQSTQLACTCLICSCLARVDLTL